MTDLAKRLVEVDEVLKYLSIENLKKIPDDIKKIIREYKDNEYTWVYDENKELKDQNLPRDTIAILSYLNMEYLLNEEQREFMDKIHRLNEQKLEVKKRLNYSPDDLFKKEEVELKVAEKTKEIVVYNESIFSKIIRKVRAFFHCDKHN